MKKHLLILLAITALLGSSITPAAAAGSLASAPMNSVSVPAKKAAAKTVSKKTTSNVHLRVGASTKHKSLRVLKKNTVLTVLATKNGWSKVSVKASKKTHTGWVSNKHLGSAVAAKKAAPKKKTSTVSINSVNSWNSAANWAKKTCPSVKVSKRGKNVRTHAYNPNNETIMLHPNEARNRYGFVTAHEMAHHYQWHYYNSSATWSAKIKNRSLETEADRIAYVIMGNKWVRPFYSSKKPTKAQQAQARKIIATGKARGC